MDQNNKKDKYKLYLLTFTLDLCLVLILLLQKLDLKDKIFINLVLLTHIVFIYSLMNEKYIIAHYIHYTVYIYILLSLIMNNIYLLGVNLFLIIVIQILWMIENQCILNKVVNNYIFGYGQELAVASKIITLILFFKIVYKIMS